jgi:hypothetical protein
VRSRWDRFWFAPASPLGLGITRALLLGGFLWAYRRNDFAAYASVSPLFYGVTWFRPPIAPEAWILAMHRVFLLALALGCVGLFTRAATALAFVLGAYLLGIDANFGRVHHNDLPVVIALGVLAASRAGDGFSLDALRRRARAPQSGEYRWPLRAIQLALATAFFAAGVAKLRHSGLDWITTDNLRLQLIERHYALVPSRGWGLRLVPFPLLCNAVAAATVAIELAYPLSLGSARARAVLVPASLLMLVGFALLFGPRFTTFAILSLVWVPWDRLLASRGSG